MSAISRRFVLDIGAHADNADWDTAAVSTEFVPTDSQILPDGQGFNYIERPHQDTGNTNFSSIQGTKVLDIPDITIPVSGLSGSGAGDGVNSSTLAIDIDGVYDCIFGAAESTEPGDTTDGTDAGSGTTVTLDGTPAADPSGNAFLIKGTTSGKYFAREVVSQSAANLTVDRALTTDENVADTADESEVVYASKTWVIDPSITQHTHYYIDCENIVSRKEFFGVMGNLVFNFPRGQYATATLTGQKCTDWTGANPASPSVTYGTTGSLIKVFDCPFYVGSDLFMAFDLSFDCGFEFGPRDADTAPNNLYGYIHGGAKPKLRGKIRARGTTALSGVALELARGTADTWRADNTYDVSFQAGRSAGRAMYIRIPNMRFEKLDEISVNGQSVYDFEGVATDRTADSLSGLARVHFF